MHDAGSGYDLVRRVACEVEAGRFARNVEVDRPYLHALQGAGHVSVVKVDIQPAQLSELGQFPQHDSGNRPPAPRQKGLLGGPEFTLEREDKNVGVKIEHRHPSSGRS